MIGFYHDWKNLLKKLWHFHYYYITHVFSAKITPRYSPFSLGFTLFFFALLVQFGKKREGKQKIPVFLRKSSSFIYFSHEFFTAALNFAVPSLTENTYFYFIATSLLSLIAAVIVIAMSKKFKFLEKIY